MDLPDDHLYESNCLSQFYQKKTYADYIDCSLRCGLSSVKPDLSDYLNKISKL